MKLALWQRTYPRRARWGLACAVAAMVSCAADTQPQAPEVDAAVGAYRATSLTVSVAGQAHDVLATGGLLDLALLANGTTSGRLLAPDVDNSGQTLDASLAGKWTRTGDTVRFSQAADTFVRDAAWAIGNQVLSTTKVVGTTVIVAVLTKQ